MPDITNDFDNNPNTDKRKQRDEEVNNDNLQPEQTKSEPELLDQTKSKEFSIPIFAKQQEYEKLKEPEKKSERRTAPLSRNQIKQNANTIAHNEQQTNDKTKTQGQEL